MVIVFVNAGWVSILIFMYKERLKSASERFIFLGGLAFLPGLAGVGSIGYSPFWQEIAILLFFSGVAFFITGQILKKKDL